MKAIQIAHAGGYSALHLTDIERPIAAPDQVLVQVSAIGVNFVDIYYREGVYPAPLPLTLGQEGSGVIVEIGENVEQFRVGERVAWCTHLGAYAEYAAVPESHLVRVPERVSFEQAAASLLQGMTAQYLTTSTFPLKSGDTVLLHAGAGGVGLILTQMAVHLGAHVISTVSTPEKAELARSAGAHDVILYTKEDFEPAVKRITGGRGVDVVYDSVGKDTFERSLKCLRPRGMMALFGASSGAVPPFDPIQLSRSGSLFLTRPTLIHYTRTREELDARATDVFQQLEHGELQLRIHASFPLAEAAKAQEVLQTRQSTGKILLIP
ncbi:MAG: quinone oxidoreductase [Acidobacteriaceae bacterium]